MIKVSSELKKHVWNLSLDNSSVQIINIKHFLYNYYKVEKSVAVSTGSQLTH